MDRSDPTDPDTLGPTSIWEPAEPVDQVNLGLLYHENTKRYLRPWRSPDTVERAGGAPEGREVVHSKHLHPPTSDRVLSLPDVDLDADGLSLRRALGRRRSTRRFADEAIGLGDLASLLGMAYGTTRRIETPHGTLHARTVPSAGARYPLEVYAAVRHVEDLDPGVFHYRPETHVLETVRTGDPTEEADRATLWQGPARTASVVFVISAVFSRNMDKYGERGYRAVLMEAGSVVQNLHLAAEALELGAVALEGIDEGYNRLIDVGGRRESALVGMPVGPRGST